MGIRNTITPAPATSARRTRPPWVHYDYGRWEREVGRLPLELQGGAHALMRVLADMDHAVPGSARLPAHDDTDGWVRALGLRDPRPAIRVRNGLVAAGVLQRVQSGYAHPMADAAIAERRAFLQRQGENGRGRRAAPRTDRPDVAPTSARRSPDVGAIDAENINENSSGGPAMAEPKRHTDTNIGLDSLPSSPTPREGGHPAPSSGLASTAYMRGRRG